VQFAVMGPLLVDDGSGSWAKLSGARLRVLLAALLLHANMPVSTEVLAGMVWDGRPSPRAGETVRSYVRRLRQALGPAAAARIVTRSPGYLVRVEPAELDVLEFEASCAEAGAALREHAWAAASAAASRALALWRGEPLLDVSSQALHAMFVPRLDQLRVQALQDQAEADLHLGRHEQQVPQLRELAARYPLRESFRAQLMLALYRCSRQAEALECYADARRVLVQELGIEPGSELRRLHGRILASDAGLLWSSSVELSGPSALNPADGHHLAGLPASGAREATSDVTPAEAEERHDDADASNVVWIESAVSRKFVGREKELGFLREAWSSATVGQRVLALVAGEPGIGKTAIVAELARFVRASGGLVLYGRWDEEVLAPYQAFREALGDYARACPEALLRRDLIDVAAEIACLWPELGRRIGACAAPPLAEAERFRLFESLDTWIQQTASRRPVLFVLDDLQWADRPSLLLLQHLLQARRSTPLLAVAMYRDTELERNELSAALPSLARDTDCRRLALRGLEHDAAAWLLEAAVGRPFGERESAMVSELERETGGNPFFLLEMAGHLSELGAFDLEPAGLGETVTKIPESVRGLIRWRLGRVSGRCAELLAVASVIGERFTGAVVASAASMGEAASVDLLEEAARAGLIAEIDDAPDCWRFSHSLARRVIADELSRSRKARLHKLIDVTLESRPDVSPAELAHDFGAAASIGSAVKAIGYERLAGRHALAEVAPELAARHFRNALELLDRLRPEDRTLRCELLLDLAAAHDRAGDHASRDERFAAAADAARRLGSVELFLRAALGYGGVLPAALRPDLRAQALLEEAIARLGEEDNAARAMILARLAHWLHYARPYPERLALSDRSVAIARDTGDKRTLATVLLHRCWTLDGPGDAGDALRAAEQILDIGAGSAEPELTLAGLRIKLTAQFRKGEHSAAVRTALVMKQLAERLRHPEGIRLAAMWDIVIASTEGNFGYAEETAGDLGRRLLRIGHPQAQILAVAQTFSWRWLQGRAAEYVPVFEKLSASQPTEPAWPAATAWCLAETGARDRAADLLHRLKPASAVAADRNYQWWAVMVGFSGAVDLVGDRQWAEVLFDLIAPYAGSNCSLGVASFLGAADHWLGVLAGVSGRYTVAIQHLEAALARHRDMGSRPWTALTQEAYGRVLTLRGEEADIDRARMLTGSAMRTAGELGLEAIKERPRLRG
jgi:DNA-binding SARP family transcriptional activator